MSSLKSAEFEMLALFEMTPDLVCIAGKDGFLKNVNPAVVAKLGYTKEELLATPITSLIHPEDRDMTKQERAKLLNGKTLLNFQNRYVAKSGNIIWLEWTSIYIADKEVVLAIAKDITERKKIEKEIEEKYIRFKSLATHFKSNIEENRKYLAVELHEELGQLATVVKIDIDWVVANLPGLPEASKNRIEHAQAVLDLLIKTIGRISFSLSPQMLVDLGLNATLEWHCKEFSLLNGIPCLFETDCDETGMTHEVKLDFFRICQESLTNVMYHAQANNVKVSIAETGNTIQLTIVDDGRGFDPAIQQNIPGLLSIRERAISINGKLLIKSEPGKGTSISVTVPRQ